MRGYEGICAHGARGMLVNLDKLLGRIEGALANEDPEDVHQLRVASRRLRAALPHYKDCFRKADFRSWRTGIKGVTSSLGKARDLDVQMIFLEGMSKKSSRGRIRDGIDFLLARKRSERDLVQSEVESSLRSLVASEALHDMKGSLERMSQAPDDVLRLFMLSTSALKDAYSDLLRLGPCLLDGSDAPGHHEMRIAAKRLRYTMELFSDMYGNRLNDPITYMKRLQDLLGELHDCDVWSEDLPSYRDMAASEGQDRVMAGLDRFGERVKELRRELFASAVSHWEGRAGPLSYLDALGWADVALPIEGPVAAISDIHGNDRALDSVLRDARSRGASLFLNAGDSVGFGPHPEEVVGTISGPSFINVQGNFDREVLKGKDPEGTGLADREKALSMAFTRKALSRGSSSYLRALPGTVKVLLGEKKVHITHASPLSKKEHLGPETPDERMVELLLASGADLLLVGHSHAQFVRTIGSGMVLNPGSVGRPDDGDPRAAYALIGPGEGPPELVRVEYDVEATVEALRRSGMPEHLSRMLIRGRSLEKTIAEDSLVQGIPRDPSEREAMKASVGSFSEGKDPDPPHTRAVRDHALSLYDQLATVHNLGPGERDLLEISAMLHDIGWSKVGGKHHINSMEMLINDATLPITLRERFMLGSVVRYHNSLPSNKHYNLQVLEHNDRRTVLMVASLLRIADALDASHSGRIERLDVSLVGEDVMIKAVSSSSMDEEISRFALKKDLFEKVYRRRATLDVQRIGPRRAPSRSRKR